MSNRRSFLRTSLVSSLAITPAVKTLAEVFLLDENDLTKLVRYAFRISLADSLLNLDFYFINVRKSGNQFVLGKDDKAAFMVVRLPQQHIAEQSINLAGGPAGCSFAEPIAAVLDELVDEPAKTIISGYSYLSFRITVPTGKQNVAIPITSESLMDWNKEHFVLQTDTDWKKSLFEFSENQYPFGFAKSAGQPHRYSYDNFPKKGIVPVTAIEAPWRLLISPRAARINRDILQWKFSRQKEKNGNVWESELWGATLFTIPDKNITQNSSLDENGLDRHFKGIELMLIGSPDYIKPNPKEYDGLFFVESPLKKIASRHILPKVDDRVNLVELYIKYKLIARSQEITFTSLGINMFIEFTNDKLMDAEVKIGLVSWKQLISFGRDEEVEVVTLLLDKEAGHKFVHIRTAKSRTKHGVTFLDYREYIMPFDLEIDYKGHKAGEEISSGPSKFNSPFSVLTLKDKSPKRICPLGSGIYGSQHRKTLSAGGKTAEIYYPLHQNKLTGEIELLQFEYEGTDWSGNKVQIRKKLQAIQYEVNQVLEQNPAILSSIVDFFDADTARAVKIENELAVALADVRKILSAQFLENFEIYNKQILSLNSYLSSTLATALASKFSSEKVVKDALEDWKLALLPNPDAVPAAKLYFVNLKTKYSQALIELRKSASSEAAQAINDITALTGPLLTAGDQLSQLYPQLSSTVQTKLEDLHLKAMQLKGVEKTFRNLIACEQQKINFAVSDNLSQISTAVSELRSDFLLFAGSLDKLDSKINFFSDYPSMPQLQKAQVYVDSLSKLVNDQVPVQLKYAEDYVRSQVDPQVINMIDNPARVFAEITTQSREYLRGKISDTARELGGYMNPQLPVEYMTLLKDTRKIPQVLTGELAKNLKGVEGYAGQIAESYNDMVFISEAVKNLPDINAINPKAYFSGLDAKILGSIALKDILGADFELPRLVELPDKVIYNFNTNKLKEFKLDIASFFAGNKRSSLQVYMEKSTRLAGQYKSFTRLSDFSIGLNVPTDNTLVIRFKSIEFSSSDTQSSKTRVEIEDVGFGGPLAFFGKLADAIKMPGTGLRIVATFRQITVSYQFAIPSIEGGAFNFANLKFGVGVSIPIPAAGRAEPIGLLFNINSPEDKFLITAGIFGGRGHFVLDASPKEIRSIDAAIEFGGYLGLNLGIARGNAFLFAGIRYIKEPGGYTLAGYLICGGSVTVFGFISVSVLFSIALKYVNGALFGQASIRYSVRVGFFKKSFTLRYSRQITGAKGKIVNPSQQTAYIQSKSQQELYYASTQEAAGFLSLMPENGNSEFSKIYRPADWDRYCSAFKF